MALQDCSECHGTVSSTAKVCPHCGCVFAVTGAARFTSVFTHVYWAIILAAITIAVVTAVWSKWQHPY